MATVGGGAGEAARGPPPTPAGKPDSGGRRSRAAPAAVGDRRGRRGAPAAGAEWAQRPQGPGPCALLPVRSSLCLPLAGARRFRALSGLRRS